MELDEDQVIGTVSMQRKFSGVWPPVSKLRPDSFLIKIILYCIGFKDMQADRQTHTQTDRYAHHNIPLPYCWEE